MRSAWSHAASAWAVSLRKPLSEAAERRAQLVGEVSLDRRCAIGADEHDLKFGEARSGLIVDIKVQGDRSSSKRFHGRGHAQPLIESRRRVKICFEMHARQPAVERVKDFAVRHPGFPEQLGFSNLDKTDERSVADDARGIDVAPTNVLFNRKWFSDISDPAGESACFESSGEMTKRRGLRDQ